MPQFITLVVIIILLKILFDYLKTNPIKTKPAPRGDFIDISEKWINADQMPYQKNECLMSNRELMAFKLVEDLLKDSSYTVFPHVPMADLLMVPTGIQNRQEYLYRIKERSLDMVVFERQSLIPALVVNIRAPEGSKRQQISDQFTEDAIKTAGYKLVTLDLNNPPGQDELLHQLRANGLDLGQSLRPHNPL